MATIYRMIVESDDPGALRRVHAGFNALLALYDLAQEIRGKVKYAESQETKWEDVQKLFYEACEHYNLDPYDEYEK